MYNLLVSADEKAWNGEVYSLELGRCVREYTDDSITAKFGAFGDISVAELCQMPSIFAYESGCQLDPKFGLIRGITKRNQQVKIRYEIIPIPLFLSFGKFEEIAPELDIEKWELNRTHWAVKNVNLYKVLNSKSICLPSWANRTKRVDISTHSFGVALSFPGGVRLYVDEVAKELEGLLGPDSYFYDENYKAQLARPDLDTFLQGIYKRAKLNVVFLSGEYQQKEWCGIEFRVIKEILKSRENNRIMYIKMDDGEVDGVLSTDGYIDARKHGPQDVAAYIQERFALMKK